MRRVLGIGAVLAFGLSAMIASAAEMTGTIEKIDLTANTFVVDGKTYTAAGNNTVGAKLSDLEVGDKIKFSIATTDLNSGRQPFNVIALEELDGGEDRPGTASDHGLPGEPFTPYEDDVTDPKRNK